MIPLASAQSLFNSPSLFRIMIEANSRDAMSRAKKTVLQIIRERHNGEDDVTVIGVVKYPNGLIHVIDAVLMAVWRRKPVITVARWLR